MCRLKCWYLLPAILALVVPAACYLEIALVKHELKPELHHKGAMVCISKEDDEKIDQKKHQQTKTKHKKNPEGDADEEEAEDEEESFDDEEVEESKNYQEICYEKDMAYSIPMIFNNQVQLLSVDTTAPISWVKGSKCYIEGTTKKCSLLRNNFKDSIEKLFKKNKSKKKHSKDEYALIEGSSELVKGFQEKIPNFSFNIRDSSRLTSLLELLLVGFYVHGEHNSIVLEETNFINATEISKNLNYLCDGAISFRFDDKSENSFLRELFEFQKITERVVTVYINEKNISYIAVGEVATKYSEYGYGGITWIDAQQYKHYGKLPQITGVIIDNNGKTYSEVPGEFPAVLTLSASYIGIPKNVLVEWNKKFSKKASCEIDPETLYLTCKNLKKDDENKILTFEFADKRVSFTLEELILDKKHSKTVLNLKESIHDTIAIFGEPFFKKYLAVFDYGTNKVGFAIKRDQLDRGLINVVSLIRFICGVFFLGCAFILCYTPIAKCFTILKSRGKFGRTSIPGETRRLKQYSPVQENPYDELSGQIKEALEDES